MNLPSLLLRLTMAVVFGGAIGMERGRKNRPAGFRTYILFCVGATLAMMVNQYIDTMSVTEWAEAVGELGLKADVSRMGAQVISGIGFLGAGTIYVTSSKEVKGLTTAACLWAAACMGLAIGAGFYEAAVYGFLLIAFTVTVLRRIEEAVVTNSRYMNFRIEFGNIAELGAIIAAIKALGLHIHSIDTNRDDRQLHGVYSAVFITSMSRKQLHAEVLSQISGCPKILAIQEL